MAIKYIEMKNEQEQVISQNEKNNIHKNNNFSNIFNKIISKNDEDKFNTNNNPKNNQILKLKIVK